MQTCRKSGIEAYYSNVFQARPPNRVPRFLTFCNFAQFLLLLAVSSTRLLHPISVVPSWCIQVCSSVNCGAQSICPVMSRSSLIWLFLCQPGGIDQNVWRGHKLSTFHGEYLTCDQSNERSYQLWTKDNQTCVHKDKQSLQWDIFYG